MTYLEDKKGHRILRLYTRESIGAETYWSITPFLFCPSCKKVIHQSEGIELRMRSQTKPVSWVRKLLHEMKYPHAKTAKSIQKGPKKQFRF